MQEYFSKCNDVVSTWRKLGPQLLYPETDSSKPGYISPENAVDNELQCPHGLYLFKHRNQIVKYFAPNFHPPYNTIEQQAIIHNILSMQWDEHTLNWKKNL
jgi:hypothetical protein